MSRRFPGFLDRPVTHRCIVIAIVVPFLFEERDDGRCEANHADGEECLAVLNQDGTCPNEQDHR